MAVRSVDTTKLLGFNAQGEPLFDIVIPTGKMTEIQRAVSNGKAFGGAKAIGQAKVEGTVKG